MNNEQETDQMVGKGMVGGVGPRRVGVYSIAYDYESTTYNGSRR